LEATGIAENETLLEYLTEEPADSRNFNTMGRPPSFCVVISLRAFIFIQDNPTGHLMIRKSNFDLFAACFCQIIRGGFNYGMVPDLINMGLWAGHFRGWPTDYDDSYEKDTWALVAIAHAYFSFLKL
jgi:hypothetical protein